MKTIKLFIATLTMALLPVLFTSCNPEAPVSIVGKWECVDATLKRGTDPTGGEDSSEKGQVWNFTETSLTIDGKAYNYTLSESKLETEYAKLYNSTYFSVNNLTENNLNLSVSYDNETKVGKTTVTITLDFNRIAE